MIVKELVVKRTLHSSRISLTLLVRSLPQRRLGVGGLQALAASLSRATGQERSLHDGTTVRRIGTLLLPYLLCVVLAHLLLPLIEGGLGPWHRSLKLARSTASAATLSTSRRIPLARLKVISIVPVRLLASTLLPPSWNTIGSVLPLQEVLLPGSGAILVLLMG